MLWMRYVITSTFDPFQLQLIKHVFDDHAPGFCGLLYRSPQKRWEKVHQWRHEGTSRSLRQGFWLVLGHGEVETRGGGGGCHCHYLRFLSLSHFNLLHCYAMSLNKGTNSNTKTVGILSFYYYLFTTFSSQSDKTKPKNNKRTNG